MPGETVPTRAVPSVLFLDRDGVICENRADYVRSWDQFCFLPGALDAVATLTRAGYRLIVVTNQSMVGRGLAPRAELDQIHRLMCAEIERAGGRITDILVCDHHPEAGCPCRKPRPGLLLQACERHGISPASAVMVGDHVDDVAAALAAGCRPIHVMTGRGPGARAEVRRRYGDRVTYLPGLPAVAAFLFNGTASEQANAGCR